MTKLFDRVLHLVVLGALGAIAFCAFGWAKANLMAELYAEKLADLSTEYESLRGRYNDAVQRAAVTELEIEDGKLSVVVRGSDRLLHRIETDVDPTREVHVDFVVRENRLLIRRLYDSETAPADGVQIDPKLASLDWTDTALARGLTVYRGALTDGRWVVTSSGNGALDLKRVSNDEQVVLREAPPVRSFDELKDGIARRATEVQVDEVLARLWK